jgi:uncharacterized protein YjdB
MKTALKKILTMVVILTLVLSFTNTVFASEGSWNCGEKVNYVPINENSYYRPSDWTSGLTQEYQLKWYENPMNQVLKGEFMLVELRTIQASLERQGFSRLSANGEILDFVDKNSLVPNAQEEAKILKSLGILSGTPEGYMEMDKPIKRSEAAKVITYMNDRVLKIPASRDAKVFYDTIGHWAESSISYAYQIGLLNGVSDTNFDPDGPLTLEQTFQILENEVGYYGITRQDVAKAMNQTFKVTLNPTYSNGNNSYESITLNKNNITLLVGNSEMITATVNSSNSSNKTVIWTSSDTSVATVNSYGLIKAISSGTAVINAKTISGKSTFVVVTVNDQYNNNNNPTSVDITSSVPTLNIGETYQLSVSVKPYSSSNRNVTWSSSNTSIVQIDSNGYLVAVGSGTAVIVARTINGLEDSIVVTVNGSNNNNNNPTSVDITSSVPTLNIGETYQLNATVKPYNSSNRSVTWSSTDTSIVQIDSNGYLVAVGGGTSVIVVTTVNGLEDYVTVTVNGSNNNNDNNNNSMSEIYVQGYSSSEYYNAFSNEDITFVVQTNQSVSSVNFSNNNTTLTQNLSSSGNNMYTFKAKVANLTKYGETLVTVTLGNNQTLSIRVCIYQQ